MDKEQLAKIHQRVEEGIEAWRMSDPEIPLIEFLGWTGDEYTAYVEHNALPARELEKNY